MILTLTNNNPIDKANEARYSSDRANMQSVFTNTVAKVLAQNQSTLKVVPGKINNVTSGVSSATGSVSYTLDSASNVSNQSGIIEFANGNDDTNTKYNTGKELPIYSAGETQWYVDEEGNITLKIGDKIYGEAEEEEINKDRNPPTNEAPKLNATTNSISVEFKQTDSSGIDDSTKQYAIKKTGDTTWGEWVSNTNNNYNFTGLLLNTSYDIKTRAKDILGNGPQESNISTINTENIPNPVITVSPTNNVYGEITVTITYPKVSGYRYQYQDNDYNQHFTSQNKVTFKMKNNYTIYASVQNNSNKVVSSATYSITNILPFSTVATQDTQYFNKGKVVTIPKGFKISDKAAEQEIDTGLVIIAPDGSEFVWVPVPVATLNTLVDVANMRSNLTEWQKNGVLSGTPIAYSTFGYREPYMVTDTDNNITCLNELNSILGTSFVPNGTGSKSFKEYMQKEYNDIYNSIKTYSGFYIGRYETGDLSKTNVVSKKGNSDIVNKPSISWYGLYAKQKKYATTLMGTNIKSNMIYGYQWDATMKWFNSSIVTNADGRGQWGTRALTGSNPIYAEKNIYDMAGNVGEWTAESYSSNCRNMRGGYYDYGPGCQFAGFRSFYGTNNNFSDSFGSRLAIYL